MADLNIEHAAVGPKHFEMPAAVTPPLLLLLSTSSPKMWRDGRRATVSFLSRQPEVNPLASLNQAKQISYMYNNLSDCQAKVIKREDLSKEDNIVA